MNNTDIDRFVRRLAKSSLLDVEKLRRASEIVRRKSDLKAGVYQLIADGYLTRWQARQLIGEGPTKFFFGQYKLLKELGQGGMGTVYRAMHPTMSRLVALKVMSRDLLTDRKKIARFQREIRTAAALDHPHIVRALDAGCENETYYLVMEHIDGKDIRYWIEAAGPLPISWCCECIRQAADGLHHAFQRGVAHRDLKPSNLLVQGRSLEIEPVVKIVDFGLARVGDDLSGNEKITRDGRTVGTWAYIAPEQALDASRADIRSDIYSLGCTLFQMISGKLPFEGKSDLDTLMMRMKGDAPRLKTVRRDVDSSLDEIVAKMLAREPAERFQTPAEVAQALMVLATVPASSKSNTEIRLVFSAPEPSDDSIEKACRNTDPEFDQFLKTTSDFTIRNPVVQQPVGNKTQPSFNFWWSLIVPLIFSVIALAVATWALTR